MEQPRRLDCQNAALLSFSDIEAKLSKFRRWELSDDKKSISRSFVAKDFMEAINFFNNVAKVAEAINHHPSMRFSKSLRDFLHACTCTCAGVQNLHLTRYRSVKIVLCTHSIEGLSSQDLELASKIDQIDVKYSPKWLQENPLLI